MSKEKTTFEQAIKELEQIVTDMENGETSLEQSLEKFERGIKLIKNSQRQLSDAEQKVKILLSDNHKTALEDYPTSQSE